MGELAAGEPPVMFPVMLPPVNPDVSGCLNGWRPVRYGRPNRRSEVLRSLPMSWGWH